MAMVWRSTCGVTFFSKQRRAGLGSGHNVLCKDVSHAITAETIAPSVGKKHLRMRPLGFIQPVFQYGPRLLGQWGTSLLPSFPCTAHMSACIDHDILSLQARQLR